MSRRISASFTSSFPPSIPLTKTRFPIRFVLLAAVLSCGDENLLAQASGALPAAATENAAETHLEFGQEFIPQEGEMVFSASGPAWAEIRQRYAVPAGATKLQFMPGLWNVQPGGILDLAEMRVEPVSDGGAAKTTYWRLLTCSSGEEPRRGVGIRAY